MDDKNYGDMRQSTERSLDDVIAEKLAEVSPKAKTPPATDKFEAATVNSDDPGFDDMPHPPPARQQQQQQQQQEQ